MDWCATASLAAQCRTSSFFVCRAWQLRRFPFCFLAFNAAPYFVNAVMTLHGPSPGAGQNAILDMHGSKIGL
jgi:hypothetical protein